MERKLNFVLLSKKINSLFKKQNLCRVCLLQITMNEKFVFKKPNFGPPPKGYIAGLGRGAVGFITRSDLGPAQIPNNAKIAQTSEQAQDAAYAQNKFDNWEGFGGALFSKNTLDEQDRQAEQAYDFCERKMDERRSKQREEKMKKQLEKYKDSSVPINQKFKDLKRELARVTVEEWQNIPQSADSSLKKKTKEKYTPVPDSVMVNFLNSSTGNAVVQEGQTNKDYRQAKQTLLKSKLNQVEQKQSSVDRVGYLTQLNTSKIDPQMIGDISRARLLLKSALLSNPKNPDLWVSAARVQQLDGKLNEARQILKKGVTNCPLNEDIWIEYSRVEKFQNAKNVIIEGLRNIPSSEKLWIYATKLESSDKQMKSKILRKGLENNPGSVRLWKELIEIQDMEQAKKLLYKAVEFIPKEIDLWLALSKIENYDNAKKVLNMARKSNPLSQAIWINAAKLEESKFMTEQDYHLRKQKYVQKIQSILVKAREILKKNGKNVTRDEWLQQAFYCQKSENLLTCEALVKMSLSYGLNQEQILNTLLKDAKIFEEERGSVEMVRYLYKHGLILLKDKMMFDRFVTFEERVEKRRQEEVIEGQTAENKQATSSTHLKSELLQALNLGTKLFPEEQKFWMMTIEKYINESNYELAQKIIKSAQKNVDHQLLEEIKLSKVRIFKKLQKFIEARCQLQVLCQQFSKGKSKIQLVKLEHELGNYEKAWGLCESFYKDMHVEDLWVLAFRILRKLKKDTQAKTLIEKASTVFPNSIKLWKMWIQYELENQSIGRARSVLDKALLKNPKEQELYLIGFQIEYVNGTLKDALFFLSKAIKACPKSAQLWGRSIEIEPIASRKKKASVAIEACGPSCPSLNCSIAKVFWKQNKPDKAKKWISSSLQMQKSNGDIWCLYLLFLKEHYKMEYKLLWEEFLKSEISEGRIWNSVVEKESGIGKEEICERVTKRIEEEFLRIH